MDGEAKWYEVAGVVVALACVAVVALGYSGAETKVVPTTTVMDRIIDDAIKTTDRLWDHAARKVEETQRREEARIKRQMEDASESYARKVCDDPAMRFGESYAGCMDRLNFKW